MTWKVVHVFIITEDTEGAKTLGERLKRKENIRGSIFFKVDKVFKECGFFCYNKKALQVWQEREKQRVLEWRNN